MLREDLTMISEDKAVTLIKQYSREADEEDLEHELMDEHTSHVFDVTASGLASYFTGIDDHKLAEFFAVHFSYYSPNTIYKTDAGYYFVSLN